MTPVPASTRKRKVLDILIWFIAILMLYAALTSQGQSWLVQGYFSFKYDQRVRINDACIDITAPWVVAGEVEVGSRQGVAIVSLDPSSGKERTVILVPHDDESRARLTYGHSQTVAEIGPDLSVIRTVLGHYILQGLPWSAGISSIDQESLTAFGAYVVDKQAVAC